MVMVKPELIITTNPLEESRELLNDCSDPIALATQALAKLRANGLTEFINPLTIGLNQITATEIVKEPDNVVDIDAYRPTAPIDDLEDFTLEEEPELGHRPEEFELEEIVEDLARAGLIDKAPHENLPPSPQTLPIPEEVHATPLSQSFLIKKAQAGDAYAMNRLCKSSLPLIVRLTGKIDVRLPFDLKVQVGMMAVADSAKRYDATKGVSWSAYVSQRIVGAILDETRVDMKAQGVSVHTYRELREISEIRDPKKRQAILQEWATAKHGLRRRPEIGQFIDQDGLLDLNMRSVEGMSSGEDSEGKLYTNWNEPVSPDNVEEIVINNLENNDSNIQWAIDQLSEKERLVIRLRYEGDMKLREIGEEWGLTESRISQIHSKAIKSLRELLAGS
jgi:RNA polymerase sigma factor for flagellar operon FliA